MKQEKKMQKNLFRKENGNKGFSLVELIIVMAIMAILTGVVGTQVVPYLNKAKESKDLQIVSGIGTAAVSAYTMYTETLSGVSTPFDIYATSGLDTTQKRFADEVKTFSGISDIADDAAVGWSSDKGKSISGVNVTISGGNLTVQAIDSSGNNVLDPVVSVIGGTTP